VILSLFSGEGKPNAHHAVEGWRGRGGGGDGNAPLLLLPLLAAITVGPAVGFRLSRLQVRKSRVYNQCSGSGSTCFLVSRIRIYIAD